MDTTVAIALVVAAAFATLYMFPAPAAKTERQSIAEAKELAKQNRLVAN